MILHGEAKLSQNDVKLSFMAGWTLWLVKVVTPTVEVVTPWFKQSKRGQSKNTTRTDAKIAACEAVKLGPSKMTAQGSSQLGAFVKLVFLLFLTTSCTNGSTKKEKDHFRTQEILSLFSEMQQKTRMQDTMPPLSKNTGRSATSHQGLRVLQQCWVGI